MPCALYLSHAFFLHFLHSKFGITFSWKFESSYPQLSYTSQQCSHSYIAIKSLRCCDSIFFINILFYFISQYKNIPIATITIKPIAVRSHSVATSVHMIASPSNLFHRGLLLSVIILFDTNHVSVICKYV